MSENYRSAVKDGLYNRSLGLPAEVLLAPFEGFRRLVTGPHAQKEARNAGVQLPGAVAVVLANIVEVEVQNGQAVKVILRQPYRETGRDLILVLNAPKPDGSIFCRTCWTNRAGDWHASLDSARYQKPVIPNPEYAKRSNL
jgi:hypothetical protein